jgi:CBS domain-containing protein
MRRATARDVMSAPILGVPTDMTAHDLATFLTEHQISGVPVFDPSHHVVGVVSTTDLVLGGAEEAALGEGRSDPARDVRGWEDKLDREDLRPLHLEEGNILVQDIMTPAVYTVRDDAPVAALARTMVSGRIHRLFVTRAGRIVGIVTSLDLLKLLYDPKVEVDRPGSGPRRRTRVPA